jgi:O-acetyl-ADP-ribose deacetylase (regulator of RNase III)
VVTAAGALPVGLLVHAIVSSATEPVTRDGVRRAFRSALERASAWQLARVAIPPMGLGAGNLDLESSAELMADELSRHVRAASFPSRVTIVAETEQEAAVLDFAISRWAA